MKVGDKEICTDCDGTGIIEDDEECLVCDHGITGEVLAVVETVESGLKSNLILESYYECGGWMLELYYECSACQGKGCPPCPVCHGTKCSECVLHCNGTGRHDAIHVPKYYWDQLMLALATKGV